MVVELVQNPVRILAPGSSCARGGHLARTRGCVPFEIRVSQVSKVLEFRRQHFSAHAPEASLITDGCQSPPRAASRHDGDGKLKHGPTFLLFTYPIYPPDGSRPV